MNRTITILLLAVFTISCSTQNDVDVKNYPLVLTIKELGKYYNLKIDHSGRYESTSITAYLDGSSELEYEYEMLESEIYDPLIYSVIIEKEKTIRDAKQVYSLGKGALKLAGNSFDQGTIEIDSLDLPRDDSYYAIRTYEGNPNGLFYIVRKGTVTYSVIISGVHFIDHSLVTKLLVPKLTHLEDFEIIKTE